MSRLKISSISAKGQTTIPIAIRPLLKTGDLIQYEIKGKTVLIKRMEKVDLRWPKCWNPPSQSGPERKTMICERI